MANLQALTVEIATGPDMFDKSLNRYPNKTLPNISGDQSCLSQKIRSTAYMSFSVLGLAITFILGGLMIGLSAFVESLYAAWQKRRRRGTYERLEWVSNEPLQLQRMVHEELGLGIWTGASDSVPITAPNEKLGVLDISDENHPVMVRDPPGPVGGRCRRGSESGGSENNGTESDGTKNDGTESTRSGIEASEYEALEREDSKPESLET